MPGPWGENAEPHPCQGWGQSFHPLGKSCYLLFIEPSDKGALGRGPHSAQALGITGAWQRNRTHCFLSLSFASLLCSFAPLPPQSHWLGPSSDMSTQEAEGRAGPVLCCRFASLKIKAKWQDQFPTNSHNWPSILRANSGEP